MRMRVGRLASACVVVALLACTPASAQFLDDFGSQPTQGWTWFTGDGDAVVDFVPGDGFRTLAVDATHDRANIWWALIKRNVASSLDLERLSHPGYELRLEARVRVGLAPRRVHLSANTQRTTDYDEHLFEFDIPDTTDWHTISMTTHHFQVQPGDDVNVQFAITDWGLEKYHADIDYLKVDVVDTATAPPDLGEPLPYHPPVADPHSFSESVVVAQDSVVNLQYPNANLNGWDGIDADGTRTSLLTVNGVQLAILRWDLSAYAGRKAAGPGLLELTTEALQTAIIEPEEMGQVRVAEILAGDPAWDQRTVTLESLLRGQPLDTVINPQMIIDDRVAPERGGKTYSTISRPVLQRLLDGKTLGLAIKPLGPIDATFYASEAASGRHAARLHFSLR